MSETGGSTGATRAKPMGADLGRGVSWLMLAAGFGKVGSFLSNVVLGWLLVKADFGLFAAAAGVAGFATVFRDGGVRQLLIQRGAGRYRRLSGPAFWLSTSLSTAAGAVLALLGPAMSGATGKPIAGLLMVMGLGVALAGAPAVYRAKIAVDLQYRRLAELNALLSVTRYGSMIVLALLGFGAMSLALPMVLTAVVEFAFGWWVTRDRPWTRAARLRVWPAMIKRTIWLVLGQMGIAVMNMGDYLVLSFMKAAAVVGLYFFAFQFIDATNVLLAVSLQSALFPALSVLAKEPERHAAGVVRSARVMVVVGAALALGTACTIGPLEQIIWRFKWSEAVVPVQVLAVFFPMRMLFVVFNSAMMSRGRFVAWARVVWVMAAGVALTAGVVGSLTDRVDVISITMGAYHGVVVCGLLVLGLRTVGVRSLELLGAVLPALAIALASACASLWLDAGVTFPVVKDVTLHSQSTWVELGLAGVRFVLLGGVFCVLYAGMLRAWRPGDVEAIITVIPGRFRAPARAALRLPDASRVSAGGRSGDAGGPPGPPGALPS